MKQSKQSKLTEQLEVHEFHDLSEHFEYVTNQLKPISPTSTSTHDDDIVVDAPENSPSLTPWRNLARRRKQLKAEYAKLFSAAHGGELYAINKAYTDDFKRGTYKALGISRKEARAGLKNWRSSYRELRALWRELLQHAKIAAKHDTAVKQAAKVDDRAAKILDRVRVLSEKYAELTGDSSRIAIGQ